MIDASFKPKPGILKDNLTWIGYFRECMQTDGLHYCVMANVVLNISRIIVSIKTSSFWVFSKKIVLKFPQRSNRVPRPLILSGREKSSFIFSHAILKCIKKYYDLLILKALMAFFKR